MTTKTLASGFYGTEGETLYVTPSGRIWVTQSDELRDHPFEVKELPAGAVACGSGMDPETAEDMLRLIEAESDERLIQSDAMSLQFIHNNGYDTLLLRDASGRAVSLWTVTAKVFGDFATAADDPASLADWDVQDPAGVECQAVGDYGDLVATVTADGLRVEDERAWADRRDFYGVK